MKILTVDPGVTTGIAFYDFAKGLIDVPETWMPRGFHDAATQIDWILAHERPDLVVSEKFTITAATTRKSTAGSYEAIQLIGVTHYLAYRYKTPWEEQTPSDAMNFCTDEKLKRLGWYKPGLDHQRDAMRHLILAAVRNHCIDLQTLLPT